MTERDDARELLREALRHIHVNWDLHKRITAYLAAPAPEPVCYTVMCNGRYVMNNATSLKEAVAFMEGLNNKYPGDKREIVALYALPPLPKEE